MRTSIRLNTFIAATLLSFGLTTSVSAQTQQELFVNIQTAETMAQGAALVLAGQALAQQAAVRILLCDKAADIAVTNQTLPTLKPRNVTPQQMLQGLIQGGAKVEVCALYLPNTGRAASDLIPGVSPAAPADVVAHLLRPNVKTLGF